jgi:phosphoribosylformimino-5-aminoimidazole carboxamide ribotide isomerase
MTNFTIYPAIDLRHGRVVRLEYGDPRRQTVFSDDPIVVAQGWIAQGATWLHVVNLDGAFGEVPARQAGRHGREPGPATPLPPLPLNLQRLAEIHCAAPGTPIQFGGGLRSLADVETALDRGAARVVLGTIAVQDPDLVVEAVRRFGSARIVVGIDAREGQVATHGWRETSDTTAIALGRAMRRQGVIRAVYTDIARDGMLAGVNVEATADLARATGLRVIASGGVASLADLVRLRDQAVDIEGVIIGQALYTGAVSLPEAIRTADPARPTAPGP